MRRCGSRLSALGCHLSGDSGDGTHAERGIGDTVLPVAVHVSDSFEGGNIRVLDATRADDILLEIKPDAACVKEAGRLWYQYFYFRASGVRGRDCAFRITNAAGALAGHGGWEPVAGGSHPAGDVGYKARASYDRHTWFAVEATSYERRGGVARGEVGGEGETEGGLRVTKGSDGEGTLTVRLTPTADTVYIAYFQPYSVENHHSLVARAAAGGAEHRVLGQSTEARDMDLLVLGSGPLKLWLIGRQHPGETMASYFFEGLLERLLDPADGAACALLARATVYCVPLMCPDGAARGYLRTNAAGANLNREWSDPTVEFSPEVLCVRDAMDAAGLDFCLDVHGDEASPYNYLCVAPGWTPRLASLQKRFVSDWREANPEMSISSSQTIDTLNPERTGLDGELATVCTTALGWRFDALCATLEMPFKDNAEMPQPAVGWNGPRSGWLGKSVVEPLLRTLPHLR